MDPRTGVVGATGLTHDWSWSRDIVEAVSVPVILAGGLGPDNVREAIEAVHPAGVDSETNTSRTDDRRRKDLDKVRTFIERARAG
jgi:phosphoribosylanthranilate isomerase